MDVLGKIGSVLIGAAVTLYGAELVFESGKTVVDNVKAEKAETDSYRGAVTRTGTLWGLASAGIGVWVTRYGVSVISS